MKSKYVAAALAFFLGGIGAHKFYLGKKLQGFLYLIFVWTYIPAILGLIEGIIYLTKSDGEFNAKYGKDYTPAVDYAPEVKYPSIDEQPQIPQASHEESATKAPAVMGTSTLSSARKLAASTKAASPQDN